MKRLIIAVWIDCAGLWAGLLLSGLLRIKWSLGDKVSVDLQVGCYLLWAAVMAPLVVVSVRRTIAMHLQTRLAATPAHAAKPRLSVLITACAMTIGALASLINVAWQVGDTLSAGIITATGVAVIAWCGCCFSLPRLIGRIRVSPSRLAWVPTILIVGVILLMLNWRLDRWIAVILGRDLAGAHLLLPMWIVHLSTLLLLIWIGTLVAGTRPKPSIHKLRS
jgi:hypothetical protein